MRKDTNKQNPTQEIRQNGRPVLWSNCEFSLSMIFNNLTGRNIPDAKEYNEYIECIAIGDMGFAYGEITPTVFITIKRELAKLLRNRPKKSGAQLRRNISGQYQ